MEVLKYPLNNHPGMHKLSLPAGFKFLKIQETNNKPVAYFLVDKEQEVRTGFYYIAAWTGKPSEVKITNEYLGTTEIHGLVTHYFKA